MIWVVSTGIALCVGFRAFITIMQKRNNRPVEHNSVTGQGHDRILCCDCTDDDGGPQKVCAECLDDDGSSIDWPCATAKLIYPKVN